MGTLCLEELLQDGRVVQAAAVEVLAIPRWELLAKDPAEAALVVEALFARIANNVHRRGRDGDLSIELLLATDLAINQTYRAQVRAFVVYRAVGESLAVQTLLEELVSSTMFQLRDAGYHGRRVGGGAAVDSLAATLEAVRTDHVLSIARQERLVGSTVGPTLYYTDPITPNVGGNLSLLTNALSQHPHCAVSIQLVPTRYADGELAGITQRRAYLEAVSAKVSSRPGGVMPPQFTQAILSYVDFINRQQDNPFQFNMLVYGAPADAQQIAGKLVDVLLADVDTGREPLDVTDVSSEQFSLVEGFATSPWKIGEALTWKLRDEVYWRSGAAATDLIRLRQILPISVLRGVFKLPLDDDHAIGFESSSSAGPRERLHDRVLDQGSFRIGEIVNADGGETGLQAGVPLSDFSRHALVVGATGYGKTNFTLGMLLRLWREHGIPFLVVEPAKTEYRSLLDAVPELNVFTPGRNDVVPFIVNPFIPPPNVTVESYIPGLMTAFAAAFEMPDPLPGLFRTAVNDCYNRYGWKSTSTVDDPHVQMFGLHEFISVFKGHASRLGYGSEVRANVQTAGVVRLTSLIEQNPNIYDTVNTVPIADILKQPTIIELNAIGDKEQKSLLMSLLLVSLFAYTKNNYPLDGELRNVFLIDEAHVLLGASEGTGGARAATVEALGDMIAEIRAYGVGVVIADQSPSVVGKSIVGNTDIKVVFRLSERESREIIAGATGMSESVESLLPQLAQGECLLSYGRLNSPLWVKVDDVQQLAPLRKVIPNQDVRSAVNFWSSRKQMLKPYRECQFSRCCESSCDFETRVDADYLAAQISEFYLDHLDGWPRITEMMHTRIHQSVVGRMQRVPGVMPSQRLADCTTIKVLRKVLLAKSLSVSDTDIARVLTDGRVMPLLEEGAGVNSGGVQNE